MEPVPILCTARLRLRPFTAADLPAHAALWADPRVTTHIGGKPRTRDEAWLRLLAHMGHWALHGWGFWAVEHEGRLIGNAGFQNFERDCTPAIDAPEAGWAFAPDCWGQGIATEAVAAILRFADARGWPRTQCIINPGNAASLRVAAKCGFRFLREALHRGEPVRVQERLAGADLPA